MNENNNLPEKQALEIAGVSRSAFERIMEEIRHERQRQDEKFGIQDNKPIEWIAILTEEVGEASKEAVDHHFGKGDVDYTLKAGDNLQRIRLENYRTEMLQVAAVAIHAIESFDRQSSKTYCRSCQADPCPRIGMSMYDEDED